VRGFLAREFCRLPSNHRSTLSLDAYMKDQGVVGIHGIDTRALTRLIRDKGCLRGVLASGPGTELPAAEEEFVRAARSVPDLATLDPVREVTSPRRFEWRGEPNGEPSSRIERVATGPTLAVLDCGMKWNILRQLHAHGVRLVVFPATATAAEILDAAPDALFLTNGPGDPRTTSYAVSTVRSLLGRIPMRGICLGHQLLALAVGADTHKLKFGHHGVNHPVQNLATGAIEITSQNHNYAVDEGTAQRHGFAITHRNLFDGTVEGMRHDDLDLFSVQYHPEAAPGPHDSAYLWDEFLEPIAEVS
jgi:carbamoyl-phosphate synthase small subunit